METISLALSVLDITKVYSGFACVPEKEECECLEGFTNCKSAQSCLPKTLLQDGECPPHAKSLKYYNELN